MAGASSGCPRRLRTVCLVSDFCHPNLGGIESHLLELTAQLHRMGLKAGAL